MTDQTNTGLEPARQTQRAAGRPVEPGFSRRAMFTGMGAALSAAALGSAVVPALASEPAEAICDKVDRLTLELSEAMGEYLNGKFFAFVAPAGMVSLHPQSQFRLVRVPRNDRDRLDRAIVEFQQAYEAVHSDVVDWLVTADISIPVFADRPVKWSGDGRYIVQEGDRQPSYWITREPHYDDGDERWFRITTGFKGLHERPDFCFPEHHLPKIVRKTEIGARV